MTICPHESFLTGNSIDPLLTRENQLMFQEFLETKRSPSMRKWRKNHASGDKSGQLPLRSFYSPVFYTSIHKYYTKINRRNVKIKKPTIEINLFQ